MLNEPLEDSRGGKRSKLDESVNTVCDDKSTIDPSETNFYLRLARPLMKNLLSSMLPFDKKPLQFRKGNPDENKPDYVISVFQHNMSVVQTLRMDAGEIAASGGHLTVVDNTNIGFNPARLFTIVSKAASNVNDIEIAQIKGKDTLTVVVGAWTHEITLIALETYRHSRLDPYDFDGVYVFNPTAFLNNLVLASNVPASAKSTREAQVSLSFTEEGVVLGTVASEWDPGSKSSVLLSVGASKRRRNFDTNVVTEVLEFRKAFTQLFDLRLLNAIVKPASMLCNEIRIEVAENKPMHVSYTMACGKMRVCVTDQYPTNN